MLVVFMSEDGRIIFTYPDVASLCKGDTVRHGERDYVIVGKRFDADVSVMEFTLREIPDESE